MQMQEELTKRLAEAAALKTQVAHVAANLMAVVHAITAKCEAVSKDNAVLSGKMDVLIGLMGARSTPVTVSPSPVPPFPVGEYKSHYNLEPFPVMASPVPVPSVPVAHNEHHVVYSDGIVAPRLAV